MRKSLTKFKRSSEKFIDQLMSKLKMVKHDTVNMSTIIVESDTSNEALESENPALKISPHNMSILCEQLEKFIDYIRNGTNLQYLIHDYPAALEKRLNDNVHELESMLREIKSANINIKKQKMQKKFVNKEKVTLTKTLSKLKDTEIREMETIVSLFDKSMYNQWESLKSTRKTELVEGFLSEIKSKQLALENLSILVTRKLTNLNMYPASVKSNAKKKVIAKAIPLPFPSFEALDISTIPKPPPMPPLPQTSIPTRAARQHSQTAKRRRIAEILE